MKRRLTDAYESAPPAGRFVLRAVRRAEDVPLSIASEPVRWWFPLVWMAGLLALTALAGGVTQW